MSWLRMRLSELEQVFPRQITQLYASVLNKLLLITFSLAKIVRTREIQGVPTVPVRFSSTQLASVVSEVASKRQSEAGFTLGGLNDRQANVPTRRHWRHFALYASWMIVAAMGMMLGADSKAQTAYMTDIILTCLVSYINITISRTIILSGQLAYKSIGTRCRCICLTSLSTESYIIGSKSTVRYPGY